MREKVQHLLVGPLALIHIISILGESSEVNDTEVTAACGESIGCGFADIVESCPYKLSSHEVIVFHHIPCLLMSRTPRGMHIVVG